MKWCPRPGTIEHHEGGHIKAGAGSKVTAALLQISSWVHSGAATLRKKAALISGARGFT